MGPEDRAGRIHRNAFLVSMFALLALALIGVLTRFLVTFRVQRQRFSADDGFLIAAVVLQVVSVAILCQEVIDRMYTTHALVTQLEGMVPPADWEDVAHKFHLWSSICLTTSWCSYSAVKLSFLFFFKKLIDRLHRWMIYWWAVTVYNMVHLAYGVTLFYIGCPYFFDVREFTCSTGSRKRVVVIEIVVLAVLDVIGDMLILAIPIQTIRKIRVRWSQKVILSFSLCLTVVMIALTIIRASGLLYHGVLDFIWETYWQFLAAEVGIFLASAVTFRSFFVARRQPYVPAHHSVKRLLKESFKRSPNRRRPDTLLNSWYEVPGYELDTLPNDD